MKSRIISVIGMHRSGTSALTKGLEALGIGLGDTIIPAAADNPKGYWEDRLVLAINKALLERCDIAWNDLRIVEEGEFLDPALGDLADQAAKLFADRIAAYGNWGFKDPRTVRVLPFWLHAAQRAGIDLQFVVAFRHPLAVAQSLQVRNGIPQVRGMLMWAAYLLPFLDRIRSFPHVFVTYDQLLDAPEDSIRKIADTLDWSVRRDRLVDYTHAFLNKDLRHHPTDSEQDSLQQQPVPEVVTSAYTLLSQAASLISPDFWERLAQAQAAHRALHPILQQMDAESEHRRKRNQSIFQRLLHA